MCTLFVEYKGLHDRFSQSCTLSSFNCHERGRNEELLASGTEKATYATGQLEERGSMHKL